MENLIASSSSVVFPVIWERFDNSKKRPPPWFQNLCSRVFNLFLERILTPRSSIRYIGLENPSACLFTAADSLLSVTNSDLTAPIFYIHRRGFSLTWLLVSLAFPSLFDTTGFLSKVENKRAAPSLNSSFMLEFHL